MLLALLSLVLIAQPSKVEAAALSSADLGLVINTADPLSVAIGEYYATRRHVPDENIVRVAFEPGVELSPLQFGNVARVLAASLPARVQVLALAWARPWRVGCLSITSAFAEGYDPARCATGCERTPFSPLYNWSGHDPYRALGVRPTMLLAATDLQAARELIDRGVAADASHPRGAAYLLSTRDRTRNVRVASYSSARLLERPGLSVVQRRGNLLWGRDDVLFYFTGLRHVPGLRSNRFLPGAVGDHLTSTGGVLLGGTQMSALRWLQAGATGSYGTVVEPCNLTGKFPSVPILMRHYLAGDTLIEAYWKSVAMPSQGVFIGEPLAAPYAVAQ